MNWSPYTSPQIEAYFASIGRRPVHAERVARRANQMLKLKGVEQYTYVDVVMRRSWRAGVIK